MQYFEWTYCELKGHEDGSPLGSETQGLLSRRGNVIRARLGLLHMTRGTTTNHEEFFFTLLLYYIAVFLRDLL